MITKFGDLVDVDVPVLLDFYKDCTEEEESLKKILRDVVSAIGNKAKVIKIDVSKNEILADSLQVREDHTFMLYKYGQLCWRETGIQKADTLIQIIEQYI